MDIFNRSFMVLDVSLLLTTYFNKDLFINIVYKRRIKTASFLSCV